MSTCIDYIGGLDVNSPDYPTVYTSRPVKLIRNNQKSLNAALLKAQETLMQIKLRHNKKEAPSAST